MADAATSIGFYDIQSDDVPALSSLFLHRHESHYLPLPGRHKSFCPRSVEKNQQNRAGIRNRRRIARLVNGIEFLELLGAERPNFKSVRDTCPTRSEEFSVCCQDDRAFPPPDSQRLLHLTCLAKGGRAPPVPFVASQDFYWEAVGVTLDLQNDRQHQRSLGCFFCQIASQINPNFFLDYSPVGLFFKA